MVASDEEEDESGENRDGRFSDGSSEGMMSPSSCADARAPIGSATVNRAGGEEDRGRGGADRAGRRRSLAIVLSAVVDE